MFIVKGIKTGVCLACERGIERLQVEAQQQRLSGLLCPGDFRRQVKIAAASSAHASEKRPPSEAHGEAAESR